MNKHNSFVKFLKKIYFLINSLLKKNLNKLNINNLSKKAQSNKVFLTFVAIIILFLSYLSLPHIYDKTEIRNELKTQLIDKFSLNFTFSKNLKYKFFPRPHFTIEESIISMNEVDISNVKKLFIYVSLDNLFSLKGITIKEVVLENTNFNLNKKNYNFFLNLLDNDFRESSFKINNGNIFFQNNEEEVLFINKIKNINYYYDPKELKNILASENEIFNISYSLKLHKDNINNKIFSKLNFDIPKLQVENIIDYKKNPKKGISNISYDNTKSKITYEWNKFFFNFNVFDKGNSPNFNYHGKINFNPSYSSLKGNTDKLNLSDLIKIDSFYPQLLKTEILNNKNLNFDLNIGAKKTREFHKIVDIILNLKVDEGLIDIDNTKFSWSNYADFKISESLLYINENQLILDAKFIIDIKDHNEIYKFLQTSRSLRPELKKIEFDFIYNFDQQMINFDAIKIDNKINDQVGNVLKNLILNRDKLQNKINFKNLMNEVLAIYSG